MRCLGHLTIFECYLLDLTLWLEASASMVLGRLDLGLLSRLLQNEWIFLNRLVTVLWAIAFSPFTQLMLLVTSVVLWPSSDSYVLEKTTLLIHLCRFQITHEVKQCMYQHINYHNTTNHSWCPPVNIHLISFYIYILLLVLKNGWLYHINFLWKNLCILLILIWSIAFTKTEKRMLDESRS